jgi:hypothetical protein
MYKAKLRDKKKRKIAINFELKRNFYKAFLHNDLLDLNLKHLIKRIFKNISRKGTFVQCNNFCNITSKSRSVFRFFGIESFITRQEILNGSFNYVKYRFLR